MSSDNLVGLMNDVWTRDDWVRLLREVELVEENLFKTDGSTLEEILQKEVRKGLADLLTGQNMSIYNIKNQLREIKVLLKGMKFMKIYTSVDPTLEMVKSMRAWVEKNVGAGIIFDIKVNPDLIGGIVLSWEGKYRDYSLRKKWGKIWDGDVYSWLEPLGISKYG
jgi:F0F1-type ATP synthase delta subunit